MLLVTCYFLVENIFFITLYQLVSNLQIILSTLVLSAFLFPYSAQSLITNLLVCSGISKHPSLPPFPALLFSLYPTYQDAFSPFSVLFEVSYLGPLPRLSSFEVSDLHFWMGGKEMLKASCQLQQVLIGERDGELGRRGAGLGEGC